MSDFLFVGDHPETLASGRRVAPGDDPLPEGAIDQLSSIDQRLLADGALVALDNPGDDLTRLTRGELDARALAVGVESPEKLPNKDAVATAIQDKENTP